MFEMCDMIDAWKCPRSGKLCDLKTSQIKKSEADLKKAMAVNSNFTNPWKLADKDRLYCPASSFPIENRKRNRHLSSRSALRDTQEYVYTGIIKTLTPGKLSLLLLAKSYQQWTSAENNFADVFTTKVHSVVTAIRRSFS